MKFLSLLVVLALTVGVMVPFVARAEDQPPMISEAAQSAVVAMGKSLEAREFSFKDRTIREYMDRGGQPLHIFHHATIVVRRPDHLAVVLRGDDGTTRIAYDGKSLTIYGANLDKYATIPVSGDLGTMLKVAIDRLGVDFPLADFLATSPDKAFLTGVTSGYEVGTVPIDGVPCRHLFFMQPPGIELELWVEKNAAAVPRRLIVTYRSLPGEPRFIAEMWGWNMSARPTDAAFELHVPAGATKIELPQGKKP